MFESNIARYSALVRRLFSVKGEVPLNVDALGIPTFPLLEGPAELAFLRNEMLGQGHTFVAGVAARRSFVFIESLAKLCRVLRVYINPSTTGPFRVECGHLRPNNALEANSNRGVRDNRWQGAVPSVRLWQNTSVAQEITANFAQYNAENAPNVPDGILQGPWVIGPETGGLLFELTTVNVGLNFSVVWEERPFEAGER